MSLIGLWYVFIYVFKQKTAYELRISDWSSDVCSSDLYDSRTSDLMKWIGAGTNLSPKMLEHLWNGYTGTLGGYILSAADGLIRWSQPGQSAEMQLRDYPVLGSFVRSADPNAARYSREMYDTLHQAEQIGRAHV